MVESDQKDKIQRAEREQMNAIIARHLKNGDAIGLWRLPNTRNKNLIVCTEGVNFVDDVSIEELGHGFIFAPFNSEDKKVFLKGDITYNFENGEVSSNPQNSDEYGIDLNESNLHQPNSFYYHRPAPQNNSDSDRDSFIRLVNLSINKIESEDFEKLVPSRSKTVNLPENFELIESFNQLCQLYPNAFISLVSSKETGTWLGASPELLVSVDNKMFFRTAAVAGTQKLNVENDLKEVAWTQKEIEEQALVSRYIINCFKKIRLREFTEHGPKTWQAGNLLHLKTDFEVDMPATNFLQLGTVMLKLLHPTSAVCGMPREKSYSFLKEHESFDRSFYSGFLGPINHQNESYLFVNLRCMQWHKNEATLYAGAGVTLDSVPQREWDETELKMNTLLQVIQS